MYVQLLHANLPMLIHAIVFILFVLDASVNILSAAPMTDQHPSQHPANVATGQQLVEVLVKAFQLAGSSEGYLPHFAT